MHCIVENCIWTWQDSLCILRGSYVVTGDDILLGLMNI